MKKGFGIMLILSLGMLVACRGPEETETSSTSKSSATSSTTSISSSESSESNSSESERSEDSSRSEVEPSTSSSSSGKTRASEPSTSTKPSEPTESSEPSQSSESTQPTEASESVEGSPDAQAELKAMHSELHLPTVTAPNGKALNIASAVEVNRVNVLYYAMDEALIMNHRQLNNETPFASYSVSDYGSNAEAQAAVNYIVDDSGQAVDLGYGITGHQQGAAGSTYLNWQEGNWSLTVRGLNSEGQDPVATAKKMVNYLEEAFLPVPKTLGQITVDLGSSGYQRAQVVWQVDEIVYRVTHQDPLGALQVAVSWE
ncbi:hypothetical protein [Enterococcus diestrammenae]|uniref:hypothetical protein n=1 Tax=Enterococcus diestrammenae TaxID=1155073 RepID=UPI0019561D2E